MTTAILAMLTVWSSLFRILGLSDINLFVQDWGSLIGLRVAGLNPDWFATISVGNGDLFIIPEGFEPFPPGRKPQ
jgi:haloalkane dehalogenase